VSVYSNRLARLKKEISLITTKKKKQRWKPHQKIMIDFINGVTKKAIFVVNGKTITLFEGDEKKGFRHILIKHYCIGCPGEIKTMDILNIADVAQRGLKLANDGVTNSDLIVYQKIHGIIQHKLVLKASGTDDYVITFYKVG